MTKEIFVWQAMPNSKKYAKDWRIHINGDADLAASFRKRIKFTENYISHPKEWMFFGPFCNKKTAIKSINRTLARYAYPPLQYDAVEAEFVSKRGNNTGLKKSLTPENGGMDD